MKQSVNFKSKTNLLAANLYTPEQFDESKKYPAITVCHPGGGVKEQTAGMYAKKLAEFGYVTVVYDASHQGESEGSPRYLEDPFARTEDVRASVDHLTTLDFVDNDRIGALGVCAGGGYTVSAARTERRIKALATVSMVDIGALFRKGPGDVVSIDDQLAFMTQVADQRTAEANGADYGITGYVPEEIDDSMPENSTMVQGHDYYLTARGQHKNAPNKLLLRSFSEVLTFAPFTYIDELLTQPFLAIAGTEADTIEYSVDAVEKAAGDNNELYKIEGASHVDLYDIPEYVNQVLPKLESFYKETL
ncbi:alpha/beta hydrolase [Staphylococcus aureus]|uniref:alpha/beta hydrolase n=1 Tax=Staphylococcus aureus TaxID=1280 RepID=UPI000F42B267|nr:alpha/beta hydrolase [Staphylococcus aureus]RNH93951.1 alpha/beta hydrolase [Staphylococcus aureus]